MTVASAARNAIAAILAALAAAAAAGSPPPDRFAGHEALVAETRVTSLKQRDEKLRQTVAQDPGWPPGRWGENLWCLAALWLNERTDLANQRLLKRAQQFIATKAVAIPRTSPEEPGDLPWTFFSVTDYVRILFLFHAQSPHLPGRLHPETEAAMKEALWLWVRGESRLADAGADDLLLLLGTENHDLNRRPAYYLVTALLQDDPAYRDRRLADGHTTAEHAAAYTTFFREWPRRRAQTGLWIEVGSTTYQKYAWPPLLNLHELSPDPVIRHRFGLLLDLTLIEEAQLAVKGRRGGGRSRASYGAGGFDAMAALLYGEGGGSSHSRVLETSRYQAPAEAILLRKRAFPAATPFVIRNRVLGLLDWSDGENHRIAADSALVNYAYRTPHFLLGSTLQNPALAYSGLSRQNRACGLLFESSPSSGRRQIHPVAEHTGGGRSQHAFWSVQHEGALLLQRIAQKGGGHPGSYHTGRLGIRFEGGDLQKIEEDGWIFATDGQAFVGVTFLDGGYRWDAQRVQADPENFGGPGDTTRILLQAGDVASHPTFAAFRSAVRAGERVVTADLVAYRFGTNRIEMSRYDAAAPEQFVLPRINGRPLDLHPAATFASPYLNSAFNSDQIVVTVGPLRRVLDFAAEAP